MDWVMMRFDRLSLLLGHFVEKVPDLISVSGVEDMPEGARFLLAFFDSLLRQVVASRIFYSFNGGLLIGYSTLHEYCVSRVQGQGRERRTHKQTHRD